MNRARGDWPEGWTEDDERKRRVLLAWLLLAVAVLLGGCAWVVADGYGLALLGGALAAVLLGGCCR